MEYSIAQFSIAMPEIFILCMASLILLVDVFLPKNYRFLTFLFVQLTLIAVFFLTISQFNTYRQHDIIFYGHYIVDDLAILSKLFIYLFGFFAFAYSREYVKASKIDRSDYYLLGLFAVLGMSIMASAFSFLTIFLGLELLSLCLYAMIGMYKESKTATEAAMKYFALGALAAGLLLYGISILYGATGKIEINAVAEIIRNRQGALPVLALIFILSGIIFKFGAIPFHMWVPDVYQGAPAPVTLFIASAPKIAAFAVLIRILVQAMPELHVIWAHILTVIAILSMFFGNLLAIAQSNLKRLFAYSSIAHIGYTLLGVIAGPYASQGYSAALFYIATYVLVVAGGFAIIGILSKQGLEFDKLDDYRGLNARNPWIAFMFLLLLFSMAGVPPTVGFFAKLGLIEALVRAHLVWLAVLALLFALIGAYYYLRVVMLMYFEEPVEGIAASRISISNDMMAVLSINGGAALVLGLLPSFLIDLCRISIG